MATQKSNATGSYFAEEQTPKTLPGSPTWQQVEERAESAAEIGAEITTEAVEVFNIDGQNQRGVTVDLDAVGGINCYLDLITNRYFMQGYLRADVDEAATTKPLNGTQVSLTAIDAASDEYRAASGLDVFKANDIVLGVDNAESANNGIKVVQTAAATAVAVAESLTDETPPASAYLKTVGFQFPSGDLDVVATSTSVTLQTTTTDCTTLDIQVGQFIYVGGDAAGTTFVTNAGGFARVSSVSTNAIVCDRTTWVAANETGTGLTVQIFFDVAIRNQEAAANIVERTYQQELTLGDDGNGTQSIYITGCIPGQMSIDLAEATTIKADYTMVAMDEETRTGTEGVKSGTRVDAVPISAFNTTSHIHTERIYVIDETDINNSALFGHIETSKLMIDTGAGVNKEHGTLGGFEVKYGNCTVSAELNAYFEDTLAKDAIRNNSDCGAYWALTNNNQGIVYDLPLLGVGGGKAARANNEAIMLPATMQAGKCDNGYTLMACFFEYLPDAAMSSAA